MFLLMLVRLLLSFFFFFNDTATTEIYTLSLHDALPIYIFGAAPPQRHPAPVPHRPFQGVECVGGEPRELADRRHGRSEEHTSELQSRLHLVCRLLLEKKKKNNPNLLRVNHGKCSYETCH